MERCRDGRGRACGGGRTIAFRATATPLRLPPLLSPSLSPPTGHILSVFSPMATVSGPSRQQN